MRLVVVFDSVLLHGRRRNVARGEEALPTRKPRSSFEDRSRAQITRLLGPVCDNV